MSLPTELKLLICAALAAPDVQVPSAHPGRSQHHGTGMNPDGRGQALAQVGRQRCNRSLPSAAMYCMDTLRHSAAAELEQPCISHSDRL